jgi:hypothetical protein
MSIETDTDTPEAPLPPGAQKVNLDGRDPRLPEVYLMPSHCLARKAKGNIYLLVYDWRKPAMEQLLKYAANTTAPGDPEESHARGTPQLLCFEFVIAERDIFIGYILLDPSGDHRVIARDKFGSGKEEEDRIVTWAISKYVSSIHSTDLLLMSQVRASR